MVSSFQDTSRYECIHTSSFLYERRCMSSEWYNHDKSSFKDIVKPGQSPRDVYDTQIPHQAEVRGNCSMPFW